MKVVHLLSALRPSLFVRKQFSSFTSIKMEHDCIGISLKSLVSELEKFASPSLAESWDNVGLLVEPPVEPKMVSTVLLTNDLTEPVLQEAISLKANFILSYHPPIFSPLKRITQATWKEKIIGTCLARGIAVYSPHTAWDAVDGGVGTWLMDAFRSHYKLESVRPIIPSPSAGLQLTQVLSSPDWSCPPHLSPISTFSTPDGRVARVFIASLEDIRLLQSSECEVSQTEIKMKGDSRTGMGRLADVEGITLKKCIQAVKDHTHLPFVRLAIANNSTLDSPVQSVAVVPGSGGSLLKGVKVDLFVTGEMSHHEVLEATHNCTSVILTDHSNSERGFLVKMKVKLDHFLDRTGVKVVISSADSDPLTVV